MWVPDTSSLSQVIEYCCRSSLQKDPAELQESFVSFCKVEEAGLPIFPLYLSYIVCVVADSELSGPCPVSASKHEPTTIRLMAAFYLKSACDGLTKKLAQFPVALHKLLVEVLSYIVAAHPRPLVNAMTSALSNLIARLVDKNGPPSSPVNLVAAQVVCSIASLLATAPENDATASGGRASPSDGEPHPLCRLLTELFESYGPSLRYVQPATGSPTPPVEALAPLKPPVAVVEQIAQSQRRGSVVAVAAAVRHHFMSVGDIASSVLPLTSVISCVLGAPSAPLADRLASLGILTVLVSSESFYREAKRASKGQWPTTVARMATLALTFPEDTLRIAAADFWSSAVCNEEFAGSVTDTLPSLVRNLVVGCLATEEDIEEAEVLAAAPVAESMPTSPVVAAPSPCTSSVPGGSPNEGGPFSLWKPLASKVDPSLLVYQRFQDICTMAPRNVAPGDPVSPWEPAVGCAVSDAHVQQWTLRAACAAALQSLALYVGDPAFECAVPLISEALSPNATWSWQKAEASLISVAAMVAGCPGAVVSHFNNLLPSIVMACKDEHPPILQGTAVWCYAVVLTECTSQLDALCQSKSPGPIDRASVNTMWLTLLSITAARMSHPTVVVQHAVIHAVMLALKALPAEIELSFCEQLFDVVLKAFLASRPSQGVLLAQVLVILLTIATRRCEPVTPVLKAPFSPTARSTGGFPDPAARATLVTTFHVVEERQDTALRIFMLALSSIFTGKSAEADFLCVPILGCLSAILSMISPCRLNESLSLYKILVDVLDSAYRAHLSNVILSTVDCISVLMKKIPRGNAAGSHMLLCCAEVPYLRVLNDVTRDAFGATRTFPSLGKCLSNRNHVQSLQVLSYAWKTCATGDPLVVSSFGDILSAFFEFIVPLCMDILARNYEGEIILRNVLLLFALVSAVDKFPMPSLARIIPLMGEILTQTTSQIEQLKSTVAVVYCAFMRFGIRSPADREHFVKPTGTLPRVLRSLVPLDEPIRSDCADVVYKLVTAYPSDFVDDLDNLRSAWCLFSSPNDEFGRKVSTFLASFPSA